LLVPVFRSVFSFAFAAFRFALRLGLVGGFLQNRIDLDLLLHERLEFHRGSLEELQRLLHLGRKGLPERKILMKSNTSHVASLIRDAYKSSKLHAIFST